MGLIILPLLIVSFIIFIISNIFIYSIISTGKFHWFSLIVTILTFTIIYSTIYMKYKGQDKVYTMDPFFDFPIKLILLPFFVAWILRIFKFDILAIFSTGLLVAVVFSGIAMVFFNQYFFGIIEYLGKEKSY